MSRHTLFEIGKRSFSDNAPRLGQSRPFLRGLLYYFFLSLVVSPAYSTTSTLVFKNVNVIDATGAPVQMFKTVVIRGNLIEQIYATGEHPDPQGARIVDGGGRYLIPGLWDMHTHVADPKYLELPDHEKIMFPLFIANGITGIRDMGGDWEALKKFRHRISQGELMGPRIVGTGLLLDEPGALYPELSIILDNAEEARNTVRQYHAEGVDFIKISSGISTPEIFEVIMDESRRLGLDVVGHIPFAMKAVDVANAGLRSNEHLTGCFFKKTRLPYVAGEPYSPAERKEIIQSFLDNDVWQVPTHVLLYPVINTKFRNLYKDPRLKYIPEIWVKEFWNPMLDYMDIAHKPSDMMEIKSVYSRERFAMTRAMRDAGVKFLAGTDQLAPYIFPGFSLHDELVLLTMSGLTTMEALQAATSNAAKFLRLDDQLGTVEVGKKADLLLIDGDPLEDIRNTQLISAVVSNGKIYQRHALDNILKEIELLAGKSRH